MRRQRIIGAGLGLMSFSSGCVDILSYRFLGQVFTSAMTGNVGLFGLSIGQRDFGGASRNVTAFAGFVGGVALGGLLLRGRSTRWRLVLVTLLETAMLGVFAAAFRLRGAEEMVYQLIGVAALAMGMQSAVAHRIGMPGVSTTYFSGTLTNIVLSLVRASPSRMRAGWPGLALGCYIAGAASAGWYAAGRDAPDLPVSLPLFPALAMLALALLIATADDPPD